MMKRILSMLAVAHALRLCAAAPPAQESFEQGYGTPPDQFPAGYNHAGRYDVLRWDVFLQGSFIYWKVSQDGMDRATSMTFVSGTTFRPINSEVFNQKFDYNPGFKVRIGKNTSYDNWVPYAEYTWFRGSSHTATAAPVGQLMPSTDWVNFQSGFTRASTIKSHWRPSLDLLDVHVSRPYYQGTKLTVSPYAGLRAAWIRQNFRVTYNLLSALALRLISHNNSYSWGVGPRAGFLAHWLLGVGFKVIGEANASLLYTRYTKVTNRQNSVINTTPIVERLRNYDCLRPNATASLGIAWGSYVREQKAHFDLAASYEFSAFWSQNMMRALIDAFAVGGGFAPSALFIQGLTASLRLDF